MSFLRHLRPVKKFRYDYRGDGFAVRNKNLEFMQEDDFAQAYDWSANFEYSGKKSPWTKADIRWRAHICVWAAKQALHLEGDFVDCGVDTGVLAGTIVKYLKFENINRTYFLFDTYEGIPNVEGMTIGEQQHREYFNSNFYFNSFDFVQDKMKKYANVKLVKGFLPDTLSILADRKIAYLSVDLNNAPSEQAVIVKIWDQLTPGAIVVIDDFAFKGHEVQHKMWSEFASSKGIMVATLPTGQGLMIKNSHRSGISAHG